ncbi:MAG: HAD hydrolase-like protein [Balneolaceae bacterium]
MYELNHSNSLILNITHPWVILFDIDGTLLTVDRKFNRPLLRSILDDLNIDYPNMENEGFSGRTDHDILTSFLVNHGYDEVLYKELKAVYIDRITTQIKSDHVFRQPHIDEAIAYFDEIGSYMGLLTGNYPTAATAKLKVANIHYEFSFGAFGEFDKDRNQLPMLAIETVRQNLGIEPDPKKFVIIGDTPRDIECAKYAGMKSVAVTTGRFSKEELAPKGPDLILENLANPNIWFKELTSD